MNKDKALRKLAKATDDLRGEMEEWINHPWNSPYFRVDWSNDAELSEDQLDSFMKGDMESLEDDVREWLMACGDQTEWYGYVHLCNHFEDALDDVGFYLQAAGEIEDASDFDEDERVYFVRDVLGLDVVLDVNVEQLIRQTQIYPTMGLHFYHEYAGWTLVRDLAELGYKHSDLNEVLEFFQINPRKVAEYFNLPVSKWPNYNSRNGKEFVDPDALFESWANTTYCGQYVILLECDLDSLRTWLKQEAGGITLLKGATIIIHDYMNGAGGLEFPLLNDMDIPRSAIRWVENDAKNRYGVQATHQLSRDSWNSRIKVTEGGK